MTDIPEKVALREALEGKIKFLSDFIWENRISGKLVREWINQFEVANDIEDDEQIHALFLLSHFLYFGQSELRSLLKSMYRDMIRSRILHEIRRDYSDTVDIVKIQAEYEVRRQKMRFLAVGNPSESGMHLLYYFRQENALPKDMFINPHEVFHQEVTGDSVGVEIRDPNIDRYIFIDDLCGSGTQAEKYSVNIVKPLKALSAKSKVSYFVLFATSNGLKAIRNLNCFDSVDAVFELDESFKAFGMRSRIFSGEEGPFDKAKIRATCQKYGATLFPEHPLGYKNGQLLIGFNHNTPDNTLPIFWGGSQSRNGPWKAVFRRYNKVYGA